MKDVIVIGGGVAGLVAARACARIGLSVTVLEATAALGGAVGSHEVAGLRLDSGAESFAVRRNAVAEFVDGLGLTDRIVAPNPAGAWLHLPDDRTPGGSLSVPLPKAGVLGIPGSPLADDVRRVIGWSGALRAYLDRLMPVLTIGREHSLGELVRKRMGRRVLDRLVEPVTTGVYSSSADDLEVDVVAPGLNSALTVTGSLSGAVLSLRSAAPAGSAVAGLHGGMSSLVGALVADLEHFGVQIETDAPVTALRRAGSDEEPTWTVTRRPAAAMTATASTPATAATPGDAATPAADAAGPEPLDARFVIIATPGAQALGLVASLSPAHAALAELAWPSPTAIELATIVIDAPELDANPRGTGALVASGTPGVTAKALTHVTAKWEWVAAAAGPGRHVIRLSYGRAGQDSPTAALSDQELLALALRDARTILGVDLDAGAVQGFARTVWGDALSPATVGAPARVTQVRELLAATPGLELTGAWLAGTGLASVIPDALAAASRTRHAALGL
ncbi:protoporphyrinogen oxidase [Cryobacterium sp. TMT2-10]|uniref:Coproporphyrinogen III oxidase n=1 Tax=Cryobacterium shii TaxID=1259235 RepID=A0AAQ2C3W7_9MICO|nr:MULTISPECIES: protoporphyrinogen oxidase [Cryobacterium]TFC41157.1 protoporphyrinogen oxidase [Cryobacterium shii]TFC87612.1 protoporphyrinogen oxidase [Cryobacterium sp. TmT2-59]TFD15634.1 protoporphyrinogen oxidase [Cryobacterium sp. TMT2-23]TFD16446.1 protoporphyrinogen oxidase [Cryobacterium sp. TMT4-10]TFD38564.1 protoporphyrinogen oxidase [Cryobacterium sp. TMT2-10]